MDLLSTGDQSGRPDTSQVDPDRAEVYAWGMFWAVNRVNFALCQKLHLRLNKDPAMYQVALDLYRKICKQRGLSRGCERWREYCGD